MPALRALLATTVAPADARASLRAAAPGFTLVELLTVMLVMSVLMLFALPSFSTFSAGASVSSAQSALRSSIELARSEAITRSSRVGICRSANANLNTPSCNDAAQDGYAARDWSVGWIVYAKGPGNPGATFEPGDVLLQRAPHRAMGPQVGRATIWAPGDGSIVFDWNGLRSAGLSGSFLVDWGSTASARPSASDSPRANCLLVNIAGRVDSSKPVGGVCP
jgi:prepilin-type N-terminal cleavage/methylation domain-containing protein